MPTDLLGHLRMSCELAHDKDAKPTCLWCEAADEIERLRAIARYAEHRDNCEQPYTVSRVCNCGLVDLQEARRG